MKAGEVKVYHLGKVAERWEASERRIYFHESSMVLVSRFKLHFASILKAPLLSSGGLGGGVHMS